MLMAAGSARQVHERAKVFYSFKSYVGTVREESRLNT